MADEFDAGTQRRTKRSEQTSDAESTMSLGNEATGLLLTSQSPAAVMRRETKSQGAGPLDPEIAADIQSARGGGQTLDDSTRSDMEGHFGVDFSNVRVHADGRGDQLSRSVEAEAFTTGTDVFFRSGRYQPDSSDGRKLLAHELTHVVQQSTGSVGGGGEVSHPDDSHEVEARNVADAVSSSPVSAGADREASTVGGADSGGQPGVHREEDEEVEVDRATAVDREEAVEEEPEEGAGEG